MSDPLCLFIGALTGPCQFDTATDFGWAGPQILEAKQNCVANISGLIRNLNLPPTSDFCWATVVIIGHREKFDLNDYQHPDMITHFGKQSKHGLENQTNSKYFTPW